MKTSADCVNNNYMKYVSAVSPRTNEKRSLFRSFWVGGFICCIGQSVRYFFEYVCGLTGDELGAYVSMVMIFLGAILTGFGIYDRIGKYAGGGSIVPITGFANSVVSPAMEFRSEGKILGTGAKLFSIAGPVIVYGTSAAFLYGIICYIFKLY